MEMQEVIKLAYYQALERYCTWADRAREKPENWVSAKIRDDWYQKLSELEKLCKTYEVQG